MIIDENGFIRCDCPECRKQKHGQVMAQVVYNTVIIKDRRHGIDHEAVVPIEKIVPKDYALLIPSKARNKAAAKAVKVADSSSRLRSTTPDALSVQRL
ncbi:MAG: hypothetical protein WC312_07280 [Candidatus Omnitrophota bacterium]